MVMVRLSVTFVFAIEVAVMVAVLVEVSAAGATKVTEVVVWLLKDPTGLVPRLQLTPELVLSLATLAVIPTVSPWLMLTEALGVPVQFGQLSVIVIGDPWQPGKHASERKIPARSNPRTMKLDTAVL